MTGKIHNVSTELLDRQLIRLRASFAKTPIPTFFSWWGTELLRTLPLRWRNLLSERSNSVPHQLKKVGIGVLAKLARRRISCLSRSSVDTSRML